MNHFSLEPNMLNMRGVFYPTGYMVLMFPDKQAAIDAEKAVHLAGYDSGSSALLSPEDVLEKIARTVGNADIPLPSAGTEGDTVRRFAELSSQGHWGLMIHAPSAKMTAHIMEILKDAPIPYAQKYRQLVIEDLV